MAQVFGATVLADLGLVAAHVPGGYLGASNDLSGTERDFLVVQAALLVSILVAFWRRHHMARRLATGMLVLNMGFFLPTVLAAPVAASALLLWQLVMVAQIARPSSLLEVGSPRSRTLRPAVSHGLTASLASWIVTFGLEGDSHPLAVGLCSALSCVVVMASLPLVLELWRTGSRWQLLVLLLAPGVALALSTGWGRLLWAVIAFEMAMLVTLLVQAPLQATLLRRFLRNPPALVVGTFVGLVLVGTVLLSFPAASSSGQPIRPEDALFTAASAACVTGLTVLDPGSGFTLFGQVVILALVQVGGLGILVLSGFAAVLLGEGLGPRGDRTVGESLDLGTGSMHRLLRFIVISTLAFEAAGATVLTWSFARLGMSHSDAVWFGIFHAVSAFCNAGFALRADSLEAFGRQPAVLLSIAALVTVGGLGFPVLMAAWDRIRDRRSVFRSHSRVVVAVSALLTVTGAFAYGALEWRLSLGHLDEGDRLVAALFQSVTLRTAGFTIHPLDSVAPATYLLMLVWMFIGASPGSTGGGIKTSTVAVLAMAVPAAVRGNARTVLLKRTVPLESVFRATSIAVMTLSTAVALLGLLLLTQAIPFEALLFETVSALATVGLSLGATTQLDALGKLVIVVAMLLGRVGPLTTVLLLGRRTADRLRYPEARIMVG